MSATVRRTSDGDVFKKDDAARTKLANIHMYLSGDRGGRFQAHNLGYTWWDTSLNDFSEGKMTPRRAMEVGLLDEVLEMLRGMPRVK